MKDFTKRQVRFVIALILGVMFGLTLAALVFVEMPAGNSDVMKVLVGFLGGAFVTMITFYFGDSDGKDE